jgi:hypothetical protein
VIEVKTVLGTAQWEDVKEQRAAYQKRSPSPDFRLIALRAAGLLDSVKNEIGQEQWAWVLWDKGGKGAALREAEIVIWKPIWDALDNAMEQLR